MMQGSRLLLLLVLVAASVRFSRAQAAAKRINCGGQAYRDSEGNNWMPDLYYQGGTTYENTDEGISGSVDDILYQTERYAPADGPNLRYDVPVTPGVYQVRLGFSENYGKSQKQNARVFHVIIEDILAFKSLDIYSEAGNLGNRKAEMSFEVHAVGGNIGIEFVPEKGNPKVNTIEILPVSAKQAPHPDITAVLDVRGEPRPLGRPWADSYSVGDKCYCLTTYDHDIEGVYVETPLGWMTVIQACEIVGPGPGHQGRPLYNTVQCGHGPANNAGDEHTCPGRTDMGREGCGHIGPKWQFDVTVDSALTVVPAAKPPSTKPSKPTRSRFTLNAGGTDDDGKLVVEESVTWKYNAGADYKIRKSGKYPKYVFRSHRSGPQVLIYRIGGFDKDSLYRIDLGFAEVWGDNCKKNARLLSIRVNDRAYRNFNTNPLDVYSEAGCGGAHVVSYVQTPDKSGMFEIVIGARQDSVKDKNAMISYIDIMKP
jgi:hypothetical protein|eukprot:CAMPEP_0202500764 /NCGR_PEP_ID=MMETSP1361-20130828/34023_1 /ASSEMBLY_ACC=CAM_ASM_000849 /TAXON_ID=210615 /ORGANISM="Staurosira complex sp., Strain CCMP2646" /LENGTH=482 /DNA_ID=CAMNT_0049133301 /DNA_START=213 /DNA_END=1661 /DNA_ORIENTATION=-